MKTTWWLGGSVAIALTAFLVAGVPRAGSQPAVGIGPSDLGGVVTSANGPEAGVWVIAETTGLPTRYAKIVATDPKHPYTQALFSAALPSHPDETRDEIILTGEVPSPVNPPSGCRFHPRCPHVLPRCAPDVPPLRPAHGREVACHLFESAS